MNAFTKLEEKMRRPARGQDDEGSAFYSAATLKGKAVPERQWLVPGLIPQRTVTLFSGDGGTGKSLLALQLSVAATAGTGWIGKSVKQGNALFLSAEDDDDELHRRLEDILSSEGRDYDDVAGLTLRSLAGEDALLAVESQLALMETELFNALERRAANDMPGLIVIDTLADVYPANENDRAKVRQFIGILRGLALRQRCAVMLLGHPSLTGLNSGSGTSGSTAWHNSVRSRLYMSRIVQDGYEPDTRKRVLSVKKQNYGETGAEFSMTWQSGVFIPDVVETGLDRLAASAKAERVFLKLLRLFTDQGRRVNHAGGPNYAPKLFGEHPAAEGMTKRVFKTAMESLLHAEKIRIEAEGPASRRVTYIAEGAR
jgi:RecA-family ATPase